jgi:hypothetical protein
MPVGVIFGGGSTGSPTGGVAGGMGTKEKIFRATMVENGPSGILATCDNALIVSIIPPTIKDGRVMVMINNLTPVE